MAIGFIGQDLQSYLPVLEPEPFVSAFSGTVARPAAWLQQAAAVEVVAEPDLNAGVFDLISRQRAQASAASAAVPGVPSSGLTRAPTTAQRIPGAAASYGGGYGGGVGLAAPAALGGSWAKIGLGAAALLVIGLVGYKALKKKRR
jgi:hypothetical protein